MIPELAKAFGIGEAIIRRDLNDMEIGGLVMRAHGGAMLAENPLGEVSFKVRESIHINEKESIARFEVQLVRLGASALVG